MKWSFPTIAPILVSIWLALITGVVADVEAAEISGRILSAGSGHPLEGATVQLIPGDREVRSDSGGHFLIADLDPERLRKAHTDSDGHYLVKGLPVGFATLFVSAPGYSEFMKGTKIDRVESVTFDFEIFPVGSISGVVVDPAGNPVSGAKIFVGLKNVFVYYVPDPNSPTAVSDENGQFHLKEMNSNPNFNCKLVAVHPDYRRGESGVLNPKPGETLEGIKIEVKPGTVFSGKVQSQAGKPIVGAEVKVTSFSAQPFGTVYFGTGFATTPTVTTDEEGEFVFRQLTAGRWRVCNAAAKRDRANGCRLW